MAFVVEDGTGLVNANSYVSVAEAKAYWDDVAFDYSGLSDAQIQVSLVKATRYMDTRFYYIGCIEFPETPQALGWPRTYAYDRDGVYQQDVPVKIKNACIEYAVIAQTEELMPVPTQDDRNQVVERVHEKVGPIETTTKYFGSSSVFKVYPFPDSIIKDLVVLRSSRVGRA